VDDDSSATGNSAAFLSITFERLAVSPPSSELGTSGRRRSGRSASGATTVAAADPAAGRSESLLLGRNGRRRSAASLIRRSKLTDILRSRESTDGSAVASDIAPAGAVKDGSDDDSKDFGREFSAAFESFASLSLDSKGGCKIGGGGGEGKVEQKFSSTSYRTPSVSMVGLPDLHGNLLL
jgi:hypothetical protein